MLPYPHMSNDCTTDLLCTGLDAPAGAMHIAPFMEEAFSLQVKATGFRTENLRSLGAVGGMKGCGQAGQ